MLTHKTGVGYIILEQHNRVLHRVVKKNEGFPDEV